MELHKINEQLEKILVHTNKSQLEFGEAKAKFENLKEQKDLMLAACSMKYEGSEAAIKRQALADEEYKEYIDGLAEARRAYLKALSVKNAMDIKVSVLQSLSGNIRAKLKLTPYHGA